MSAYDTLTVTHLGALIAFAIHGPPSDLMSEIAETCPDLDDNERAEIRRALLELRHHRPAAIGCGVEIAVHERAPVHRGRAN